MKIFEANITAQVLSFLRDTLKKSLHLEKANQKMQQASGIIRFFEHRDELENLKKVLEAPHPVLPVADRAEYGDFQTNADLADNITAHLAAKGLSPDIVIEPTCGKGNFIIASLRHFKKLTNIFGVEIYKPYVWETKFSIIGFFLDHPDHHKPAISISHGNVFEFNFKKVAKQYVAKDILVLGNPPWVTNAKLGILNSANLPKKTNFKNHRGLDAMTGKGNFDIAEFITLSLIEAFQEVNAHLLLLIKNAVIKNIIFEQRKNRYRIAAMEKYGIDSKKEFNVSVEASLFYCKLGSEPAFDCQAFDFYDKGDPAFRFGWINDKFVSNMETYLPAKAVDGRCPFTWRQGLKHDCSKIMELDKENGHYVNGLKEKIDLEAGLVYGLFKSSDLKNTVIDQARKYTIVTQKKIGQDTAHIEAAYPKTYRYLTAHRSYFAARKSRIYHNKPQFSIFGIGQYSFRPYKVAISGLYKTFHFTLVLPQSEKPAMLDDTCYFIGFDKMEFAVYTLMLLNSAQCRRFLQSITFADAKRTFTKAVLMRIDLLELAKDFNEKDRQAALDLLNENYGLDLTLDGWDHFLNEIKMDESASPDSFY